MPTIEIAIFEGENLRIDRDKFQMAIMIDNKLVSHRGLFIQEFENQNGIMLHLGNSEFKESDEVFFGGDLIDWSSTDNNEIQVPKVAIENQCDNWGANQQNEFQFNPEYRTEIEELLKIGINKSKVKRIGFLTDYQFGPEEGRKEIVYSIKEFWKIHDTENLVFNTIYEMYQ